MEGADESTELWWQPKIFFALATFKTKMIIYPRSTAARASVTPAAG